MGATPRPLALQRRSTIVRLVPQRPRNFDISHVSVESAERTAMIRTGPGVAAPQRFTAYVDLASPALRLRLTVVVSPGGLPVVETMKIWGSSQTPLTSGTLRKILMDPIVRAAIAEASVPATDRPDIAPGAFQVEGHEHEAWIGAPAGATDRVRQIARLYNEALTAGSRAPSLEAAEAVHISRAQAARYVRKARELDLIPPVGEVTGARPAPAGGTERQPVAAAIVTSGLGVLVGRRNDGKPPWTFIAGEVEPGERPEDAAIREVKEETGLEAAAGGAIGERVHPATGRTMIYLAARPVRGTDVFVGDETELAEVRWVSLAEADELLPGMFGPVRDHLARELGERKED